METNNTDISLNEPLVSSNPPTSATSYDTESALPMVQIEEEGKWYPGERYVLGDRIPLSRVLFLIAWYYEIVWGGIAFTVDYVCTSGMRATFSLSLVIGTMYVHFALFERSPKPLTYTWAKQEGFHVHGRWIYLIYYGTSVLVCAFFAVMACLFQIIPWEDFWDWNC